MDAEAGLIETYRGSVAAWECDVFGHLNIAFYVERFADGAADLLERAGPVRRWRTLSIDTSYEHELRAGEGIAISSGVVSAASDRVLLAHVAVNSASGERTTRAEHVLVPEPAAETDVVLSSTVSGWQRFAVLELPAGDGTIAAGRDRVRPGEVEAGRLSLLGLLHRFSAACLHDLDAIGMTEPYRRTANRGFATFETRLAVVDSAVEAGEGLAVSSGIIAVGGSSLRLLHAMRRARDGRLVARFYQAGVHLDLAARRSTPFPAELRERAERLRIAR